MKKYTSLNRFFSDIIDKKLKNKLKIMDLLLQ